MSVDKTASSNQNSNDNAATMGKKSPSTFDHTFAEPKSIFDTPKSRPPKKRRFADIDISNIDIDAERLTRSMARAMDHSSRSLSGLFIEI